MSALPLEIERKFIVKLLPSGFDSSPSEGIQQGYIVAESSVEVRIRAKEGQYWQTVKRGKGIRREEVNTPLSQTQFDQLFPLTEGQRIEKTRYTVDDANHAIEVDVYQGTLAGLVIAEVEFKSLDESKQFRPPDWFGSEVTNDERYKNKNLALHGLPNR